MTKQPSDEKMGPDSHLPRTPRADLVEICEQFPLLHDRICDLELLVATMLRVGDFNDVAFAHLEVMLAQRSVDRRSQDLRNGKGRTLR